MDGGPIEDRKYNMRNVHCTRGATYAATLRSITQTNARLSSARSFDHAICPKAELFRTRGTISAATAGASHVNSSRICDAAPAARPRLTCACSLKKGTADLALSKIIFLPRLQHSLRLATLRAVSAAQNGACGVNRLAKAWAEGE